MKKILLLLFLNISFGFINAQGIVINEILANAPGGAGVPDCDGGCLNENAEWIELYNTSCNAADISCYSLITTKFAIVFPAGTIVQPFSYFVIGSSNFGTVPIDLEWHSTSVNDFGAIDAGNISNNNDFVLILDDNQTFVDGIKFGSPSFTNAPTTLSNELTCSTISLPIINNSLFPASGVLSGAGSDGETWARNKDGGCTWVTRAGSNITKGASNGAAPHVNFSASDSTLCPNQCISFTDLTVGTGFSWQWDLQGGSLTASALQNPTNICYAADGIYDVSLTITDAGCEYECTKPALINVAAIVTPVIAAPGTATCTTVNVVLSITNQTYTSYQWNINSNPIAGATLDSLVVTQTGNFSVTVFDQSCSITSPSIGINGPTNISPTITVSGSTNLCFGDSVTLTGNAGFTYQWLLNNAPILGATSISFTAHTSGSYSLIEFIGLCNDTSTAIVVNISPQIIADISPPNTSTICSSNSVLYNATPIGGFTYSWSQNNSPLSTTAASHNASTSGLYKVIVSDANGCTSADSATLVVNAFVLPTITSTVPSLSLCTAPSMTLSVPNTYASYIWLKDTNNVMAGATSNAIVVSTSSTYSVLVMDANGCSDTTALVFVNNGFNQTINITSNGATTFCQGNTVTLTATPFANVSYQWFNSAGQISGETSQSIVVSATNNYSVLITDANACTGVSTATSVLVNPLPIANISASGALTFCQGQSVTMSSANTASSFQWLNGNNPIALQTTSSYTTTLPGNFSLLITDANGCADTSNILVADTTIAFNPLIVSSTGNFGICQGGTILLTAIATVGAAYQWKLNNNTLPNNTASISASQVGDYAVVVTDANGCTNNTNVNVVLFASPIPIILPNNIITICSNEFVNLFTNSFNNYSWSLNGTAIASGVNQSLNTNQSGTYTVTVTDSRGCTGTSASKIINSAANPNPTIISNGNLACEGETSTISVLENYPIYNWFNNENTQSTNVTSMGSYWVNVIDTNNCKGSDTVLVFFKPIPTLTLAASIELPCGEPDTLRAVTNATTIAWTPSIGLSSTSVNNPGIKTTKETYYVATVYLDGCKATDSVLVTLGKCDSLYIPEAFTPNDDGFNDVFKVQANGIKFLKLRVFDRWGTMIFFSSDPDFGWDGKFRNHKCPEGIYTWQVEAYDYFEKPMLTKSSLGKLVLIR